MAPVATLVRAIREVARPLSGGTNDYDALLDAIGDARLVLLGEATHGTHEFYCERAAITRRLVEDKGFAAVAVEADWPDAFRVSSYVRGCSEDESAVDALAGFRRFPTWMWRNAEVLDFVGWLRAHNERGGPRVGFYGLDLYSLYASIEAVLRYLTKVDPAAAQRARARYACFDHHGGDTQSYGYLASIAASESCEDAVVRQLLELELRAPQYAKTAGSHGHELFEALQNARVVRNAERYYRTMFRGRVSSWNLRDRHMNDTLEALFAHLSRERPAKIVVWAHNSHLGDARATEMARRGELNLGQLVRERWGREAFLIGFTTHRGTVAAASDWDEPAERKRVRPALEGSIEDLLHRVEVPSFLLPLHPLDASLVELREPRLERAIGVVYRPDTERHSHYFEARVADQFDAVLHFDDTRAVEPLERGVVWESGEVPETFPMAV